MSTFMYFINSLLRQGKKLVWTNECEDAFLQVKFQIKCEQTLNNYDLNKTLMIVIDANSTGSEACLSHIYSIKMVPIAFASKSLTQTERK